MWFPVNDAAAGPASPCEDRQTLRRDELLAAGVELLGGDERARA